VEHVARCAEHLAHLLEHVRGAQRQTGDVLKEHERRRIIAPRIEHRARPGQRKVVEIDVLLGERLLAREQLARALARRGHEEHVGRLRAKALAEPGASDRADVLAPSWYAHEPLEIRAGARIDVDRADAFEAPDETEVRHADLRFAEADATSPAAAEHVEHFLLRNDHRRPPRAAARRASAFVRRACLRAPFDERITA
jgi:hypothetical protein